MSLRTSTRKSVPAGSLVVLGLIAGAAAAAPSSAPTVKAVKAEAGLTAPAGFATGGKLARSIRTWVIANEGGPGAVSPEQAAASARSADLVTANAFRWQEHLGTMRAANPSVTVLAYVNGAFAQKDQNSDYPSSWYARDARGTQVRSKGYGNLLMDVSQPGWVADRAATCKAAVDAGFDGCFLDMLGTAAVAPGYTTGQPIEPTTKKVWRAASWLQATANLGGAVSAAVGDAIVWGNGAGSGTRWYNTWSASSALLQGVDGAAAEAWLRSANAPLAARSGPSDWNQSVAMLDDADERGGAVGAVIKLWAPGTNAQKSAALSWAVASYLLGAAPSSYLAVSDSESGVLEAPAAVRDLALGAPLGPRFTVSGVQVRWYQGGLVAVNPTARRITVALPTALVDAAGGQRTRSLDLTPRSGLILRAP